MMTSYCYPISSDTKSLPVCVCGVGVRELDTPAIRTSGYPYSQLFVCAEGSGKIITAQKRFNVQAGDMVFVPAQMPHELVPTDSKWQLIGVDFDGNSVDAVLESLKLTKLRCEKLSDHETLARKMLAAVRLLDPENIMDSYPYQLSGGMRQRVGIAMALVFHPEFLLADEPTSALDVTTQAQIVRQIQELRENFDAGILMITHNLALAAYISDNIYVLKDGKVADHGTREDILHHPRSSYTKMLLQSVPGIGGDCYV